MPHSITQTASHESVSDEVDCLYLAMESPRVTDKSESLGNGMDAQIGGPSEATLSRRQRFLRYACVTNEGAIGGLTFLEGRLTHLNAHEPWK